MTRDAGRGTRDAKQRVADSTVCVGALALLVLSASPANAQRFGPRIEPEIRADAFLADRSALHGGVGASVRIANSVRAQLVAAVGAIVGGGDGTSGRVDVIAHYLVDPRRQATWGFYGGGGVSARYDEGEEWHGELVVLIGAERRLGGALTPFLEIGYGGGVKLGTGVRIAR